MFLEVRMRPPGNHARHEPPILLVKWYDVGKWVLERVESFPENQRFLFGPPMKAGGQRRRTDRGE
jgi:hypothetical protein